MPGWLRAVRRWGLERAWLGGMLLAIACFGWTTFLSSGQIAAFALICALSGIALGADLALPGALLARLVERHGAQGRSEGAYLGWWNLATKLNLALAAGAALPLLQWGGLQPRHPGCPGAAAPGLGLCRAALRPQAAGRSVALPLVDSSHFAVA